jgi:hypothetical protein
MPRGNPGQRRSEAAVQALRNAWAQKQLGARKPLTTVSRCWGCEVEFHPAWSEPSAVRGLCSFCRARRVELKLKSSAQTKELTSA